jgi:hypothetical protein
MIPVFIAGLVSDSSTGTDWNNRAKESFRPETHLMSIFSAPLIGTPAKPLVNPNGLIVRQGARRFHLRLMRTKQELNLTVLEMFLHHDPRRNCIPNDLIEFNWQKTTYSAVGNSRGRMRGGRLSLQEPHPRREQMISVRIARIDSYLTIIGLECTLSPILIGMMIFQLAPGLSDLAAQALLI